MTHDADAPAYRHPITHPTPTPRGPGASALRERLLDALETILTEGPNGEYRTDDAMSAAATLLGMEWHEAQGRWVHTTASRASLAAARADAEPALSVERLRALSDAATPGVWTRDADYIVAPRPWVGARPDEVIGRMSPTVAGHWDHPRDEANAALVVAAVNFARAALAAGAPTDGDGSPEDMEREAGRLLVASAKARMARGGPNDAHEVRHLHAAVEAGNSDGEDDACRLDSDALTRAWPWTIPAPTPPPADGTEP